MGGWGVGRSVNLCVFVFCLCASVCLVGHLVGRSVDQLVSRASGQSISRSCGWSFDRSVEWSVGGRSEGCWKVGRRDCGGWGDGEIGRWVGLGGGVAWVQCVACTATARGQVYYHHD